MAKFSVFFNDHPLHSVIFESGVVHIGRDESNDLYIDSLAFAPAHAAVILRGTESIIKQLNADFPLIINGTRHSKYNLKNGDIITVGKHHIVYNPEQITSTATQAIFKKSVNKQRKPDMSVQPEASLQIIAGKHIGRIIQITKNITNIGHKGVGIIIIVHRKEGYFVSVLEPNENIKINNTALADKSIFLKNGDIIFINHISMQFLWTVKT